MRTLFIICLMVVANSCASFQTFPHKDTSTLFETRSTHIYTIYVSDVDHVPIEGATITYEFVNEKYPSDNINGTYITDSDGYFGAHFSVHPDPVFKEELVFGSSFTYSIYKLGYFPKTGSLHRTVKGGRTFGFLDEDREEVILIKQ